MPSSRMRLLMCLCAFLSFSSMLSAQSEGTVQQTLTPGPYQITPGTNSAACAENRGGDRGTAVDTVACAAGQTNQQWTLTPMTNGGVTGYQIISANSGFCMDVTGGSTADGAFLDQWPCANQPNQVWQLYPFGSSFEIVSINGGQCLNFVPGSPLQQHTCGHGNNPNELWSLNQTAPKAVAQQNLPTGPYVITPSANSGACAENRGVPNWGATVDTVACAGGKTSQMWTIVPIQNGSNSGYEIVSTNSGLCMDIAGGSTADGALLDQWPCANQPNQVWQLYAFGSSFQIVSINGGECLSFVAGAPVQQHTCAQGTNPNELWTLKQAGPEGVAQQNLPAGPYQILSNTGPSACAENRGIPNWGTSLDTVACVGGQNSQVWTLTPIKNGSSAGYQIVSANSGLCMDVTGGSTADGAVLDQWPCANQPNQVWQAYPFGSSFELVSINGGKCLNLAAGIPLQQHTCAEGANPNELWNLTLTGPEGIAQQNLAAGPYQIQPGVSVSACTENRGGNQGTSVDTVTCATGQTSQLWTLAPIQNGSTNGYQIVSANSGFCMDVTGGSTTDGAPLDQWPCANQPNQVWQLYPFGSSFEVVSINGGKCLNFVPGAPLQQHTCGHGSNPNELWNLPLPASSPIVATTQPTAATPTPVSTTMSLQATPTSAVAGQSVTITALIAAPSGTPSGSVSFMDGAAPLGAAALDATGTASYNTGNLASGTHTLTAQYSGSALYAAHAGPVVQVTVSQLNVGEQALQADSFVDSVGVATHLAYTDTPYFTQWTTVLGKLQSLGVRHIRDGFYNWPSSSPIVAAHQQLAAAGIKTTYVVPFDNSTTPQILQAFATRVQDVDAFEGSNECDAVPNCGGGNETGINNVVQFMPTIYTGGKAAGVPVVGPSFTMAQSYSAAGNLASEMTYNNLHVYFGGRYPGSNGWGGGDAQNHNYGSLAWWMDQGNLDAPNITNVVTETGYVTYPTTTQPYTVPESVEASYLPRTLLLSFNSGIQRTFVYELLDEYTSDNYGLLRSDLSIKPAFTAIKNLLSLLTDAGASFSPGKLNYTLTGGDSTLNHTLLQKRDGSFWLILWLEQSSYNEINNTPTPVTPQTLTLSVNGVAKAHQVIQFDSTGASTSTAVTTPSAPLPLTVNDQLTIVRIAP